MPEAQNSVDSLPAKQDWGRNDLGSHRIPASAFEVRGVRVVVTGCPNNYLMRRFVADLLAHRVTELVRVCDTDYSTAILGNAGIVVTDLVFPDGTFPPENVIAAWLDLVRDRSAERPGCGVAVHCQSGLGRSPVMAALVLLEMGITFEDAVATLRAKMRGALNAAQLAQLERYSPRSRGRMPKSWSVFVNVRKTAQLASAQPATHESSQQTGAQKARVDAQSTTESAQEQLEPVLSLISKRRGRSRWRRLLCCPELKGSNP